MSLKHLAPRGYRPDIDGLRAIAVLGVLGFHLFPEYVPGGFIGVDIFFVISGYLISAVIFDGLAKGKFSFSHFYARRIIRIFPALLCVFIASYVFGWFVLLPDEYGLLGKHIANGAAFISNWMLYSESGYFDPSSDTKLLLHLWSLGIEEQFYIFWPVIAWLIWPWRQHLIFIITGLLTASFVYGFYELGVDPVGAFYLPQARFWELLGGVLIAAYSIQAGQVHDRDSVKLTHKYGVRIIHLQYACSAVGLAILVWSIFFISKRNPYPGFWGVLPVLGTSLVLIAGPQAAVNRLLSGKILVWFGLISYPLYLWHWPLYVYMRIIDGVDLSLVVRIGITLASIALAWLTYRFIEAPIRFGGFKTRVLVWPLCILMVICGFVAINTMQREGLPFRAGIKGFTENALQLQWGRSKTHHCPPQFGITEGYCYLGGDVQQLKVAVMGDSTANALAYGLGEALAAKGYGVVNMGAGGCAPFPGIEMNSQWEPDRVCDDAVKKINSLISNTPSIDTVVIAFMPRLLLQWKIPGVGPNSDAISRFDAAKPLIDRQIQLLTAQGKKVILTFDAPFNPIDTRDCLARPLSRSKIDQCASKESDLIDREPYLSYFSNEYSGRKDICVFNQSDLLIDQGKVRLMDSNGVLLLRDRVHLSMHGSKKMAQRLLESSCLNGI